MKRIYLLGLACCFIAMLPFVGHTQIVNTIAGNGTNVVATGFNLALPQGIATDRAGNIYIADAGTHCVRKVSVSGSITTVAGTGIGGYLASENGYAATAARLNSPTKLVVDSVGNLFILDKGNARIRKVDTNGIITVVAGGGSSSVTSGVATAMLLQINSFTVGRGGKVFITLANSRIAAVTNGYLDVIAGSGTAGNTGNGGLVAGAQFGNPDAIHCDRWGNIYVYDNSFHVLRKINAHDTITHFAGNGSSGYAGDGGLATAAVFNTVGGITADGAGNVYVTDRGNNLIRKINTAGMVSTVGGTFTSGSFAGDGGPATSARLNYPVGITINAADELLIGDVNNYRVRKIDAAGIINTVAGNGSATAFTNPGDGGFSAGSRVFFPVAIASGINKELVFTEYQGCRVRRIDSVGTITTIAGTGTFGMVGNLDVPATSANIGHFNAMCADRQGNYYFTDDNWNRVYKLSADGKIRSIAGGGAADVGEGGLATAASFGLLSGIVADRNGNVIVADKNRYKLRLIDTTGHIFTFAGAGTSGFFGDGGPATNAQLNKPNSLAIDTMGNVYLADNNRIRKIDIAGTIYTVAGSSTAGTIGDGGSAAAALVKNPQGLAIDRLGNLIYAEDGGSYLRMIKADGTIDLYGGNGIMADKNPVMLCESQPTACAFTWDGDLVFTEAVYNRVRRVYNAALSISTPSATICDSASAGFTATFTPPAGAIVPVYVWSRNGVVVGADTPYYSAIWLRTGDLIKCSVLDSLTGYVYAVAVQTITTTRAIPRLYIGMLPNDTICVGQTTYFTAVPVNGGSAPAFAWYRNGTFADTGTTYTYVPAAGDIVTCQMISNAQCRTKDTAGSQAAMTVMNYALPSVAIVNPGRDTVCSYTDITLRTSLSNSSVNHRVDWYRNGSLYHWGVDSLKYRPVDGDSIYCKLTANGACATKDTVYSQGRVITVWEKKVPVLAISSNPGSEVHRGTSVTCTPVAQYEGDAPVYIWSLNGNEVASGPQYVFTPQNNDVVYCEVISNRLCMLYNSISAFQSYKIDDEPEEIQVSVFPNPNSGSFTVNQQLEGNDGMNVIMTIYDNSGRNYYSETLVVHNNKVATSVDYGRLLAEGVYYIDFYYFTGRKKVKFVVKY